MGAEVEEEEEVVVVVVGARGEEREEGVRETEGGCGGGSGVVPWKKDETVRLTF